MCARVVIICSFVFEAVSDQYKTQEICNKTADNYAHALEFVPH